MKETLNRNKPYQEVQGELPGVTYEQDGKLFTASGDLFITGIADDAIDEAIAEEELIESLETKAPEVEPWKQELLDKLDDYMSRPEIMHGLDRLEVEYSKYSPTAKLLTLLKDKLMEEYGDR